MNSTYESLARHRFISLVTFKRNGDRVATPLWFAADNGALYAYSDADAWKIRRIRNNPNVEIAPCTMRGKPVGPYVHATAMILDDDHGSYVHGLLNRKYWLGKRLLTVASAVPELLRIRKSKPDGYIKIVM